MYLRRDDVTFPFHWIDRKSVVVFHGSNADFVAARALMYHIKMNWSNIGDGDQLYCDPIMLASAFTRAKFSYDEFDYIAETRNLVLTQLDQATDSWFVSNLIRSRFQNSQKVTTYITINEPMKLIKNLTEDVRMMLSQADWQDVTA